MQQKPGVAEGVSVGRLPSVWALIGANVLPLLGVVWLGWEVFPLMFLFWLENVIIGGFNVLRMLLAEPGPAGISIQRLFLVPFFCVHYGMFCLVHGVFVWALFGPAGSVKGPVRPETLREVIVSEHLHWAALALAVSHGFSFLSNYLGRGEYRRARLDQLMAAPYARVVVLHVVLLAGGFLTQAAGSPLWALLLLVVLKTGTDLWAHLRERRRWGPGGAAGGEGAGE